MRRATPPTTAAEAPQIAGWQVVWAVRVPPDGQQRITADRCERRPFHGLHKGHASRRSGKASGEVSRRLVYLSDAATFR